MLVRCLYASRAAKPLPSAVIEQILEQSQKGDPQRGITGLLCFTGDIFVQVLEGGRDEVCELFNAIIRNDRHQDVRLLVYEEIAKRNFGNWTMGEVKIESINPALLLKNGQSRNQSFSLLWQSYHGLAAGTLGGGGNLTPQPLMSPPPPGSRNAGRVATCLCPQAGLQLP